MSQEDIIAAFQKVTSGQAENDDVWVKQYTKPEKNDTNQFLFFFET